MIKATAQTIVKAALETLREEGFAGASSRAIARRGGFNQALIFYHFGCVEAALLAAIAARRGAARALPRGGDADRDARRARAGDGRPLEGGRGRGHVRVVAQVIAGLGQPARAGAAGASSRWSRGSSFARETLERVLPPGLPVDDLAYGIVVWYVGANLMAHLEPDGRRTDELFARAREWAPLLGSLLPP